MKRKNKGRKIYKTKEKNYYGKTPAGKAFSVGLTVLLIGGIGFLGYSAAEPIVNYTKKKGDKNDIPTSASLDSASDPQSSYNATYGTIDPGGYESAVSETYKAAAVTEYDMTSLDLLSQALNRIPGSQDIEYVEIPLKVSGGNIYYSSSVFYATQSGAIQNLLSLDDIVRTVRDAGYKPAAIVSIFRDNILPRIDRDSGYITAYTDEQWIDNDYEVGGKPWTSPYSNIAVNYAADIVGEISGAGFDKIVCSDLIFPNFRQSDLELLSPQLSGSDRYMALTSAANLLHDRILANGSSMLIEVSASELLKGNDDIIVQPMVLNVKSIILNINIDEISYGVYTDSTVYEFTGTASEKVKKMLELVSGKLSAFNNVAVRISGVSVGTDELLKAKEEIAAYGYSSFVIG